MNYHKLAIERLKHFADEGNLAAIEKLVKENIERKKYLELLHQICIGEGSPDILVAANKKLFDLTRKETPNIISNEEKKALFKAMKDG